MSVISIQKLTKMYGTSRGILDVDLEVQEGEIYGFIGPNGAGKSTTIKLLLNLIFPTAGAAKVFGLDIVEQSAQIKQKIGYVPGEVRYYEHMTAQELLEATLSFHGMKNKDELEHLCTVFEIERNKKLGELSLGNKKKVAIAAALVHSPALVLLDEPTSGLDPLMQKRLFDILRERNQQGMTVFLSSHNLNEVQEHCTKAAFIKEGKIIEVQELSKEFKRARLVTLDALAPAKEALAAIGAKLYKEESGLVSFIYDGETNGLTKTLAGLDIQTLTVENTSLESKFLSYYDRGTEQ